MRTATLLDGDFAVEEVATPECGRDQLLVRVKACGICGSDLSLVRDAKRFVEVACAGGYGLAAFDPTRPVSPGHEFAGTVEKAGPEADGFEVGDRVCGIGVATDPETGDATIIGYSNSVPGGFSEYIAVDAAWARQIPKELDFAEAALAEPLHVGETHVQQSRWDAATPALVVGAGPIGQGVIIALSLRGAEHITVVEPSPRRRELAKRLGAHTVVPPPPEDIVSVLANENTDVNPPAAVHAFECSGRAGMLEELMRTLPHGSQIQVPASQFTEEVFVPVIAQFRQISVNFGHGPVTDPYGVTLERLATGAIDPGLFITGRVGLDGIAEAVRALGDPERHVKVMVEP